MGKNQVSQKLFTENWEEVPGRRLGVISFEGGSGFGNGGKFTHQEVVKGLCGVVAGKFLCLDHSGHFGEPCHVPSWADGDFHVGDFNAKDVFVILGQSGPFFVHPLFPIGEGDDEIDALLLPYRADAKEIPDIDDSDTAALHISPPPDIRQASYKLMVIDQADADPVVRHQAVVALDQGEGAFAFPYPAFAADQCADAANVQERPVYGGVGSQLLLQQYGCVGYKKFGAKRGLDQWDGEFVGNINHDLWECRLPTDNYAGDVPFGKVPEDLALLFLLHFFKKCHLPRPEKLDPFVGEIHVMTD